MILPRDQIRRVLQGRKTEARVPTSYAELRPDKVVPVQPSVRAEASCRVRVVTCTVEELGQLDARGAWNEGFKTTDHFFAWFELRFGNADRTLLVYVRRFVLVNVDPPLFLAKQNGLFEPQQYVSSTSSALPHEPEAVPAADQVRFALEANQAGVVTRSAVAEARRQRWSLSQRLSRLEAGSSNVDRSKHLRVIERRIEAMEGELFA